MNRIYLALAFIILLGGLIAGLNWCHKEPEGRTGTNLVTTHHGVAAIKEKTYRAKIDSTQKPVEQRQVVTKIEYRYIKVKDQQTEQDYRNGKVNCDSVILSKNNRITKAETIIARNDTLRKSDSLKLNSFASTVSRQNLVIDTLGRQADDYKAKAIREKEKRFGVGVQVGYGLNGPYIGAGLSYDLWKF